MGPFLRSFDFDRLSFWLGFLAGALGWWLLGRLQPYLLRGWQTLRTRSQEARENITAPTGTRLKIDTLRLTQRLHLAAPLFSLDEIHIEPRFMAPPPLTEPGAIPAHEDITDLAIPYMPDWPEMSARYGGLTLTLEEALSGDANLVLTGRPGSGKTTTLALIAARLGRDESPETGLAGKAPLFVHAADLALPERNPESIKDTLQDAISLYASPLTLARLDGYLEELLQSGQCLLLLDGLDELPINQAGQVVDYLRRLLGSYPDVRTIATASTEYYDGLAELGFFPLALAAWEREHYSAFIARWSELWLRYVQPGATGTIDHLMLNSWLRDESALLTPLEITLKIWAAYAGDALGPLPANGIEAYVRRMEFDTQGRHIPNARAALEKLALQMVLSARGVLSQKDTDIWLAEWEKPGVAEVPPESSDTAPESSGSTIQMKPSSIARTLPNLIDTGLLRNRVNGQLNFTHPILCAYLASCGLVSVSGISTYLEGSDWNQKPGWDISTLTSGFLAADQRAVNYQGASTVVEKYLKADRAPLHLHLLSAAFWLRQAPEDIGWRTPVLRKLAAIIQDNGLPLGLRARAISALATSNNPGMSALFHQLTISPHAGLRQLGALAYGLLWEPKAIDDLVVLLGDSSSNVARSACLALVANGSRNALEAVADALMTGSEELRRFAAEALANNPEEGHPTLQEGATLDELAVRRAAVYGLQRVHAPWSADLLNKLQIEEEQWIVKDAATRALDLLGMPEGRLPHRLLDLHNTPWLISFAGERGVGIAPGKAAHDQLITALTEGNQEQKLAAMDYIRLRGTSEAHQQLYRLIYGHKGELQEAAFQALWHIAATGVELPPPSPPG